MSTKTLMIGAACLCVLPLATAHADDKVSIRLAIQAEYNRYSLALARKDLATILAIKAPGYVSFDTDGKSLTRTPDQERKHTIDLVSPPNTFHENWQVMSLDLEKDGAIVTVHAVSVSTRLSSQTGHREGTHTAEVDRDFWIRSGTGWVWKRSRILTVNRTPI
jgi:ketosteroid isomerase-like protein